MTTSKTETVRVIAFPGAPNLPTFAALELGFFKDEGIDLQLELTPSSIEQAQRAAAGEFDIICTAFDNVVAYNEKQGAAGPDIDPQYTLIMGATQLDLSLVSASSVKSVADLKGKTIALDALSTGFAFVLYDMLEQAGLQKDDVEFVAVGATPKRWHSVRDGEHAATLTIEPFTSIARANGFNVLESSSQLYDSYQGGTIAARGAWLSTHQDQVRAFIRAYLRGQEWVLDEKNADAAAALLQARMPAIQPRAIAAVMKSVKSPLSGLTPDAAILREGMKKVLELRSRFGDCAAPLSDPERYFDLSHYQSVVSK